MMKPILGTVTVLFLFSTIAHSDTVPKPTYPKCTPRPLDVQALVKKSAKCVSKLCRGDHVAVKGVSGTDVGILIAFHGKTKATLLNENNCDYKAHPVKQLIKLTKPKALLCHRKKGDEKTLCRGDSGVVKGEGDSIQILEMYNNKTAAVFNSSKGQQEIYLVSRLKKETKSIEPSLPPSQEQVAPPPPETAQPTEPTVPSAEPTVDFQPGSPDEGPPSVDPPAK